MKTLICCLILAASVGNNGKASFDGFSPANRNVLSEDTANNTEGSCNRPCKFNVKPRRCHFKFKIEPILNEDGSTILAVNGLTPGPMIRVCVKDTVIVEVYNKVPDQDIAIHWHGIEQRGTPFMDGVPMVTQCPITYGSKFRYAFRANSPGTFFYHSDSVSHQSDGVYGALVVNQPQPLEPHSSLYDYDRSEHHTLIIGGKFSELLTGNLDDLDKFKPTSLVINGNENSSKVFVLENFAYRLRFINALSLECPVHLEVERHEMLVIGTDGKPVKPVSAKRVRLYPGERMDVVVKATQPSGAYWIRAYALGNCVGADARSMLIYSGFNYTSMLLEREKGSASSVSSNVKVIYGQELESLFSASHSAIVKSVYLGIDKNYVQSVDNDYRYISDAIPKKPFFPATLALQESGLVQINGKNFLYPNVPLLLKSKELVKDNACEVGAEDKNNEPQCLQLIEASEGQTLEVILMNEGYGSNDSYTFHMHGFSMYVVATWQNPTNEPVSKAMFEKLDSEGKILRNTESPVVKDTVVVPNKGYTIVHLKLDQRGSWLLECRACSLISLPTAVAVNVPLDLPEHLSQLLSSCGNFRPPDVLLN